MNKTITVVASFVLGAAAGATGAWYILKKRYADLAQEEIDSVKAVFSKRLAEANEEMKKHIPIHHDSEMDNDVDDPKDDGDAEIEDQVKEIIDYTGYSSQASPDEIEEKLKKSTAPYIISPEEFGEYDDYDPIELTYFADGILGDDALDPIDNVEEIVGFESLNHFGEYEDDSVYVRNDRLRADYVIVRDERTYSEAMPQRSPSRRGVL